MSQSITIARPYARAIFEQALAEKKLAAWAQALAILAQSVVMPEVSSFIANPNASSAQHVALLQDIASAQLTDSINLEPLLVLLADNKRLMLLPEIKIMYDLLKAEQEKTLLVDVVSFSPLSASQEKQLIDSLSQRLQRSVELNLSIDSSLIGGAVIQAGDLVIDGSVRGQLNKLSADLVA